MYIETNFLF